MEYVATSFESVARAIREGKESGDPRARLEKMLFAGAIAMQMTKRLDDSIEAWVNAYDNVAYAPTLKEMEKMFPPEQCVACGTQEEQSEGRGVQ